MKGPYSHTGIHKIGGWVRLELTMKQSDAVQFLYRDLKVVTSDLLMDSYDLVFEEEMEEYFPFNANIMEWLGELYKSEKYGAFDESQLSLYYEKEHPFLFIRDLAFMNSWNMGYQRKDRLDHITGLMFSETPTYSVEATLCLCRPSLISEPVSQWFDFKQAMNNLEKIPEDDLFLQAWKACALYYLYFQLSQGQPIEKNDLNDLLEPYKEAVETARHQGEKELVKECEVIKKFLDSTQLKTTMDGVQC